MKCHFSSPQILLLAHEPLKSPDSEKYMKIPDYKFSLQKPITGVRGEKTKENVPHREITGPRYAPVSSSQLLSVRELWKELVTQFEDF